MSHYKPCPTYKDSGVEWIGRVPEHWEVKRLRHVATLNPSPDWRALEQQQREYPFFPMEAIGEAGELESSGRKLLDDCRSGYTYFAEGDVAFAKVTPCFENGKGAVLRGLDGGHGFGTTELTVLRPTAIDRDYLYALTLADSFRQPGASEMLGSGGLKRVPDEFTRNYRIALPPPAEQSAIAAALDRETARIDALIAKKTRFIELLKEKRQALITDAVTKGIDPNVRRKDSGVAWIGEMPEHWEVVQSRRMFSERRERARPGDLQFTASQKYGVIPQSEFMEREQRQVMLVVKGQEILKHIEPGDFLISMRSFEGGLEECTGAGSVSSAYVPLTPIKWVWNPFFRYLFKCSSYIQALQATSDLVRDGQALRFENFSKVPLPGVPPQEQRVIAAHLDRGVSRIDALAAKTERSIALLKERRSALITAAVTGQIDLREEAA